MKRFEHMARWARRARCLPFPSGRQALLFLALCPLAAAVPEERSLVFVGNEIVPDYAGPE